MALWSDMSAYEQLMDTVAVKLAVQSRWRVRKYGGFAEGVRRDLNVTKYIAEDITERMTFAFRFRDRDKTATETELAAVVDHVLKAIPANTAFLLTSRNIAQRDWARQTITRRIVEGLTAEYDVTKNDVRGRDY